MKFLVDNAVSPLVSKHLNEIEYSSIHVRDVGMAAAIDPDIFDFAVEEDRIIISADTDFGTLLVMRSAEKPSFILFRQNNKLPVYQCQQL
ncbi:MAG: DUF5615 family PIN-like protein [Calditrichota bacterium]|mgnify:CR=1 FL=1